MKPQLFSTTNLVDILSLLGSPTFPEITEPQDKREKGEKFVARITSRAIKRIWTYICILEQYEEVLKMMLMQFSEAQKKTAAHEYRRLLAAEHANIERYEILRRLLHAAIIEHLPQAFMNPIALRRGWIFTKRADTQWEKYSGSIFSRNSFSRRYTSTILNIFSGKTFLEVGTSPVSIPPQKNETVIGIVTDARLRSLMLLKYHLDCETLKVLPEQYRDIPFMGGTSPVIQYLRENTHAIGTFPYKRITLMAALSELCVGIFWRCIHDTFPNAGERIGLRQDWILVERGLIMATASSASPQPSFAEVMLDHALRSAGFPS